MKTIFILALSGAVLTHMTYAGGQFSNAGSSNVPENNMLARQLAAADRSAQPPGSVAVERPTQHYYSHGIRYDYGWRSVWERAQAKVVVHGPGDDYTYTRPADNPRWEPPYVFSRAWGKVVPFPVDYTDLPVVAPQLPAGTTRIEPANPPPPAQRPPLPIAEPPGT